MPLELQNIYISEVISWCLKDTPNLDSFQAFLLWTFHVESEKHFKCHFPKINIFLNEFFCNSSNTLRRPRRLLQNELLHSFLASKVWEMLHLFEGLFFPSI